ncbi:RP853 family protein [Rickettsia endosymbiont of Halotydeus destructor]|uniref:RP853 family protein n=1 Tax=Rickettsia endosymbiont of Halotydeus destructor TaxID=2996754 RepID=UPI003BAF3000
MNNIDSQLFKKDIIDNFINNISNLTCSTLAHMISIDYAIRLFSKPDSKKYISSCILKLKSFLGYKVINDDSFSVALTLFAVAIAPVAGVTSFENNVLAQSQGQDIVAENLVNIYFRDIEINAEDREIIKKIFKSLLKEKNSNSIINYIEANSKLFCTSVKYAIKKYQGQDEINLYVKKEIDKILAISLEFTEKNNTFKQTTGKIAGAICALAVGAMSVATAGVAFSLIVIPASILAIKYAPKIGEKIGELLLNSDPVIKLKEKKISEFKTEIQNNNQTFLAKEKVKERNKNKEEDIIVSPSKINLVKDNVNLVKKSQQERQR